MLVLIGAGWINSIDPKTGKRRLDNQKDYVRVEVRGALTRDIAVVPVLLDGAELPDEAELPDDIKGLLNRNAEFVEYRTFDADVQRLIKKSGVGRGTEVQGGLSDKPRAKKIINRDWAKHWVTPMAIATVLLAAAVIGILVSWTPGLLSFRKAEVTTNAIDNTRQAAEAKLADADKALKAAQAQAADADKGRRAAEAQADDAQKARQIAEAKLADVNPSQPANVQATVASPRFGQLRNTQIFVEGDLVVNPGPRGTAYSNDLCAQFCANDTACKAYSFNKSYQTCSIWHSIRSYTTNANLNYDSGIRLGD